jgi:hypothetical protein
VENRLENVESKTLKVADNQLEVRKIGFPELTCNTVRHSNAVHSLTQYVEKAVKIIIDTIASTLE